MNRSDEVNQLIGRSIDAKSSAQAYRDLGNFLHTFPDPTPFHRDAVRELSDMAHAQARIRDLQADELAAQAAALEL